MTRRAVRDACESFAVRDRERLLWRIHRRYQTRTETLHVGRLHLSFTRITDPDRVLDMVADEEDRREKLHGHRLDGDHLHLPYWAELWESALGLATWLERSGLPADSELNQLVTHDFPTSTSSLLPGGACPGPCRANDDPRSAPPEVLDLGCGMGLAGTVAAALGANVTFADLEPPALLFARLNSLRHRRRVTARRVNWQTDCLGRTFDLILGADILYEREQWPFLEPFWRAHLSPGGHVLLGEPGRQTGELFLPWIRSRGWELAEAEQPIASRPRPIRIFSATAPIDALVP